MRRIMYLRKSRSDNPDESVEEVLSKHETLLQEYAVREYGAPIPDADIYREVVSGESIEERVEIKRVLKCIESDDVIAVLVVEPQRLSRGDLEDCGRLISLFRYTHTLVITPMMTYDLNNKMERRFFQDELMRGRDYLEYVKEILNRGRISAVKRGCFIGPIPPLGYDRVRLGKDWTLRPNADAPLVQMIFRWYLEEGMTPRGIAVRLNKEGIPAPRGSLWGRDSIHDILKNIHYTGKVRYFKIRDTWVVEDGERRKKHLRQPQDDVIIAEGKHEALIDTATFQAVQDRMALSAPRSWSNVELVNPLAGVFRCSVCGNVMSYMGLKHQNPRYCCRLRPSCCRSILADKAIQSVIYSIESSELPKLRKKMQDQAASSLSAKEQLLHKLNSQMAEYRRQEEKQYDLLETGKYTQDLFDRRNAYLREKIQECEKRIANVNREMPSVIDYREKITTLEKCVEYLQDSSKSAKECNTILRSVIDRIEYIAPPPGTKDDNFSLSISLRF